MAISEAEIKVVLEGSYSASGVAKLEEYVKLMCEDKAPYIFDAVRTLVKLYQLFPFKSDGTYVGYCCALAMQKNCNGTDLLALSYMIPEPSAEPVPTILKASQELTACKFTEFWSTYNTLQSSGDAVIQSMSKAAVPRIQQAILETLSSCYKECPLPTVLAALNVSAVMKSPSIAKITGDTVIFVSSLDNTKREKVYQEGVSFSTVSSLLQKMAQ